MNDNNINNINYNDDYDYEKHLKMTDKRILLTAEYTLHKIIMLLTQI